MEPIVLIQVDENPNCESMDGLVFQPRTTPRAVSQVRTSKGGRDVWCEISGMDEGGGRVPGNGLPDRRFGRWRLPSDLRRRVGPAAEERGR